MFDTFDALFDPEGEATCIGCGCTDSCACDGGCYWLAVDYDIGKGVCSCCPKSRPKFRELLASEAAGMGEAARPSASLRKAAQAKATHSGHPRRPRIAIKARRAARITARKPTPRKVTR